MGFRAAGHRRLNGRGGDGKTARAEVGKALIEKSVQERKEREKLRERREELVSKSIEEEELDKLRKTWSRNDVGSLFYQLEKVSPSDFTELSVIGQGSFGQVVMVRSQCDGQIYAMKKLSKREMMKRGQVSRVWLERYALISMDEKRLCKLHFAFQDEEFLYMVMDFLQGGDLLALLCRHQTVSEDFARHYIAELVIAVDSMHKRGLIHRDIKPDNILFDKDGHLALSDFGLCKGLVPMSDERLDEPLKLRSHSSSTTRTQIVADHHKRIRAWKKQARVTKFSSVGTPNYIAPEVVKGDSYCEECDWWSVGCVLYEMLVGHPPFCADTPQEVCQRVVRWKDFLVFPKQANLSPEAENLLHGLLSEPKDRLGSVSGVQEIMSHPFFAGIDWDNLEKVAPPFVPVIDHEMDLQYFDETPLSDSGRHDEMSIPATLSLAETSSSAGSLQDRSIGEHAGSPVTPPESPEPLRKRGSFRTDMQVRKLRNHDVPFVGFTYKRFQRKSRGKLNCAMYDEDDDSSDEEIQLELCLSDSDSKDHTALNKLMPLETGRNNDLLQQILSR
mmetsp:Transcript_698/g.2319  ORF Transcript_698/g.2319 Transcript_698/m.2319 type:complete len:559 (-) Transcript_698:434-2110(-)